MEDRVQASLICENYFLEQVKENSILENSLLLYSSKYPLVCYFIYYHYYYYFYYYYFFKKLPFN